MQVLNSLLTLCVCAALVGCGRSIEPQPEDAPETPRIVMVVGDSTSSLAIDNLSQHSVQTSSSLDDQANSALLIVVQDSTVGPMPIHLEIAKKLQKRPERDYLWVFTNTSMIADLELLELEELECRDIFNSQGLPGDTIQFAFDSPSALVRSDYRCPRGWDEIARYVKSTTSPID